MKQHMKWVAGTLTAALLIASCQKEIPTAARKTSKQPATDQTSALLNAKGYVVYYCYMGKTSDCTEGAGSCTLQLPPKQKKPWDPNDDPFRYKPVRYHSPVHTGQGPTGEQMMMEFLEAGSGIEEGFLGPDDLQQPTIYMHPQIASSLGYSSIEVLNQEYTPVFTTQYPYGYVILNCIAVQ